MEGLKTTNKLLLVLVIPVIFYLLKILHFIFIPLIFGMFIALLFMPLMRKMERRRIPKPVALSIAVLIIVAGLFVIGELIKISSNEINSADASFVIQAETKIAKLSLKAQNNIIDNLFDFIKKLSIKQETEWGNYYDKTNYNHFNIFEFLFWTRNSKVLKS